MSTSIQELAQLHGFDPEWVDIWGNRHQVSEEAFRALLQAMEIPVDSDEAVHQAINRYHNRHFHRWLEPVQVLQESHLPVNISIQVPEVMEDRTFRWMLELEGGKTQEGELQPARLHQVQSFEHEGGQRVSHRIFELPVHPPQGYHVFRLMASPGERAMNFPAESRMKLIVTPERCYMPPSLEHPLEEGGEKPRVWGPSIQLYTLRSKRNWGIGDFTDLAHMVDWCAREGAGVIGLNPLHALFPHNPEHASPYSPSTRLFYNTMYIDIEAVPEFETCDEARRMVYAPEFQQKLAELREKPSVDYLGVAGVKYPLLELIYQSFHQNRLAKGTERAREFQKFVKEKGADLENFALFEALRERFIKEDPNMWGWPVWPEQYRDPKSPAVKDFAAANRERIDFHLYLQWLADEQLHAAGLRAYKQGLAVGIYMDLAVGSDRGGAAVWSEQNLFAHEAAVGAPPDELNQKGQNWGLPPMIPDRLREAAYEPFVKILRQNMLHSGALRIDHVMALLRLYWIPPGLTADKGAYVHYPLQDLMGILALESRRNQCLVIGEDLGTVPDAMRENMQRWNVLSYKVFFFEKHSPSEFMQPGEYPDNALVTVSTHDLPTLEGFWQGQDINIRTELELYPSNELRERQIRDRVMERVGILSALARENLLPEGITTDPASVREVTPELVRAIHVYLARTGSKLKVFQFEDVLGQIDQVNLPGTTEALYPNWRRKLTLNLEEFDTDPRVKQFCEVLRQERKPVMTAAKKKLQLGSEPVAEIPRATYRLQFNQDFTFQQAGRLAPYLGKLGISHCYASPLLTSRPGSLHGYDITNHKALNPEIGTQADFNHFISLLQEHGNGLILDIVPNHMGIGPDNPWWMDVLENGPASLYADYFDIDWEPLTAPLHGQILLPILGDSYGQILENGEIRLSYVNETGLFWLNYYDHRLPVNPSSYPMILSHRQEVLATRLGGTNPSYQEYLSIIHAFEHLPAHTETDAETRGIRARETGIARNRLIVLCNQEPRVRDFIQENLHDFLTDPAHPADPTNLNRLHRLMESQAYRLANWRVASDEINYRRFFDINDLAALRVEDARVFADTHSLILDMIKTRQIKGLRVDHPDGLFDPTAYFRRVQEEAAARLGLEMPSEAEKPERLGSDELPVYLAVEKILAPFEQLPRFWTVQGTTGYEFAKSVGGLFVDTDKEKEMTRLYERFIGRKMDCEELVYYCKRLIIRTSLTSEMSVLSMQLKRIAEKNWVTRDYTLNRLRDALTELVACFPVYRTYVTPEGVRDKDREYIEWAVRAAKKRSAAVDISIFDFIRKVLLLAFPDTLQTEDDAALRRRVEKFAMKFQQYTGPVTAKGMEDTAFYRYNRLVSLNEVGGEPHRYGTSVAAFHHHNLERLKRTPHAMLTTSTHDTKRSEDVRARISVLSEIPERWQRQLSRWSRMNRAKKTLSGEHEMPDRNDEYLLYQTLLGVWPLGLNAGSDLNAAAIADVAGRVENYMLKAIREAKVHTSWINQNGEYEEAMRQFVRRLLDTSRSNGFLADFLSFKDELVRPGLFNALSQTVLKLTCPGVPDIYRGTELWDFSLVDPDNRRPVDYGHYIRLLEDVAAHSGRAEYSGQLLDTLEDGRIKLLTMTRLLNLRAGQPELFDFGDYAPLEVFGSKSTHVVAFSRRLEGRKLVVVVPRLTYALLDECHASPTGASVWRETRINPGDGVWRDIFTGKILESVDGSLRLANVLNGFPVSVLLLQNR